MAERKQREPGSLIPLTPAIFHILLALANGESHGYSIMREVEFFSHGKIKLGPGTLYRSIQRMEVEGFIEEVETPADERSIDERRRYYRLTEFGWEVASAEANRLAILVEVAVERELLSHDQNEPAIAGIEP